VPESDDNLRPEIRHVLFIDIGLLKLLIEEQKERLGQRHRSCSTAQCATQPTNNR
jgi:hypothetical protein